MIDQIKYVELVPGINLHLIKSSKFKTILFGAYIQRPLNNSEVSLNALLSRMLDKATESKTSPKKISEELDYMYGSVLVSAIHKYGEKQMIQIKLQMPNAKYIGVPSLIDDGLRFLNEIIHQPKIVGGAFDEELFESEKKGLIYDIKSLKEDKGNWSMGRCIEEMCRDEAYSIHEFGTVDQVQKITAKELYTHYKKIITTSPMDIIVIGDYDFEEMLAKVRKHLKVVAKEKISLPREPIRFYPENVHRVEEFYDIQQGKLALGYRMNVPYESPDFLSAVLVTVILGYGGSSKLFKEVRENKALCYSIFGRSEKMKSIFLVYSGVDFEKFDEVERVIKEQIDAVKQGHITMDEVETAKKVLTTNVRSISDFPNSYINFYYMQYLTGGNVDVEAYVDTVNRITLDDIVRVSQELVLDTVVRFNRGTKE